MKRRVLFKIIENIFNNLRLRNKFMVLYISCVILPLVATDVIVLNAIYEREANTVYYDMESTANLFKNYITNLADYDTTLVNSVNMNYQLNTFLDAIYPTAYDYYDNYYNFINNSFFETMSGLNSDTITIYADNPSILNGLYFKNLDKAKEQGWYKMYLETGLDECVIIYYDEELDGRLGQKNKFLYIKNMTYFKTDIDKIVVIENDFNDIKNKIRDFGAKYPISISAGTQELFTNQKYNELKDKNIERAQGESFEFLVRGTEYRVNIYYNRTILISVLKEKWQLIIWVLLFTLILPLIIMRSIEKTIIIRIQKLDEAFGKEDKASFTLINKEDIYGADEITSLMKSYNYMVDITNTLIKRSYKDKLKEQESDLARKNAELLALQSQINPHFMFNALESIRMHSLLKNESETAEMVGRLAFIERQNVEWGSDCVTVKKELESVEAYLGLQSYRFGNRLSFELKVEEGCDTLLIPKLTVVTFVENACVHGIESKASPGWIFVHIYRDEEYLFIEVEDTGEGMEEDEVEEMLERIKNVTIDDIRGKRHVGILNACLRIKLITEDRAVFNIDSEKGIGMSVNIKIPIETLDYYKLSGGNALC